MLGNQKEEISEATQITGYMLMINAVACFLTAPILGSLSDVYGRKIVWILVNLATIIDVAAMSFSPLSKIFIFLKKVVPYYLLFSSLDVVYF